ncbi:MAG: carbohydrate binding domain-containing protein, partial [Eubacterium sp.]|nr:carbohydrate binding domain-containing protein [Eubacterium sp.]
MTKETPKRVFALALSLAMTVPVTVPATALAAVDDDIENAYADRGYHLVWNDEFNGNTLNTDDWNVELHEPGWVNAELQRYTKLNEGNIEVKDGKLSIYPKAEKKEDAEDQGSGKGEILDSNGFDDTWSFSTSEGGAGSCEVTGGVAVVNITDPGTVNYGVQLQKGDLPITKGHTYTVSFKATATKARACEVCLLDPDNGYKWYGGSSFNIGTTEDTYTITVDASDKDTSDTVAIQINFGSVNGFSDTSVAADVILSDISIIDETAAAEVHYKDVLGTNSFDDSWSFGTNAGGSATVQYDEGAAILDITATGTENYGVQLQKSDLSLTAGHEYQLQFAAQANTARACEVCLLDPVNGYSWYGGSTFNIGTEKEVKTISIPVGTDKADSDTIALQINFGTVNGYAETSVPATVTLSDVSLVDLSETTTDVDVKKAYNYTSGRVNTQGKQDFVYGYFETRARVPEGQGYLPAFWLMASDEGNYGQWPKCGEVDIMEVMGQDTSTSYHTIHYGYNASSGHRENQRKVQLPATEKDFYEDYHTFGLEWLPGKLIWYVDGKEIGATDEWYTGKDETSKLTYPAPFDQEFYVILNLAIGGSWVGYPDQAVVDDMANQSFDIDYVRVYQLDAEDYEVMEALAKEPEKTSTRRNPDAFGNYVVNGNFANDLVADSTAKDGWELHLESENKDSEAVVANNEIKISQAVVGTVDHSCQLKQANIPMVKGYEYELTFDAYADEAREIKICVEGDSDNNWARYFGDEVVSLTTGKQSFKYHFTMTEKTDDTCCLEFALGNQGSTAPVHISNVKLVQTGGEEIIEKFEKSVGADGNYILNGTFDQGEGRLGYWEVAKTGTSSVSVTNELQKDGERIRELKVEVPEGASEAAPVIVSQSALAPIAKGTYEFSFDAYTEKGIGRGFKATIAGQTFSPTLTPSKNN